MNTLLLLPPWVLLHGRACGSPDGRSAQPPQRSPVLPFISWAPAVCLGRGGGGSQVTQAFPSAQLSENASSSLPRRQREAPQSRSPALSQPSSSCPDLSCPRGGRTELQWPHLSPWRRKWQPTPVFLPGESQGRGSLVGCRLWDSTESETTEGT